MMLDVTGLSGVSDIIGEVLAKGGIDTKETGLSKRDAEKLMQRSKKQGKVIDPLRLSTEQIKDILHPSTRQRNPQKQAKLHAWMAKKRAKKMIQYKEELENHREKEVCPYKPPDQSQTMSMGACTGLRKNKNQQKEIQQENLEKRKKLAHDLMSDLMANCFELPKESTSNIYTSRSDSPETQKDRPSDQSPVRSSATQFTSQMVPGVYQHLDQKDTDQMYVHADDYICIRDSYEFDQLYEPYTRQYDAAYHRPSQYLQHQSPDGRGRIRKVQIHHHPVDKDDVSDYLGTRTSEMVEPGDITGTNGSLGVYTKQLHSIIEYDDEGQQSAHNQQSPITPPRKSRSTAAEATPEVRTYIPYTDMVRMQRPHVTRANQRTEKKATSYVERLASMGKSESVIPNITNTPISCKEQETLNGDAGTKHLPDANQDEYSASPVARSYAECFKEMKRAHPIIVQLITRRRMTSPTEPGRMQKITRRGMSSSQASRHKPMTYVERLQQLQPETPYIQQEPISAMASHKATLHHYAGHQPKSAHELSEKPPTRSHGVAYGPILHKRYKIQPLQSLVRSQPYASPNDVDDTSIVSQWSVDDEMKKMLYEDGESYTGGTSMYDPSETSSNMDYILGMDYSSMLDMHKLRDMADAASVGSTSILSFIDWDAVEKLIADIREDIERVYSK